MIRPDDETAAARLGVGLAVMKARRDGVPTDQIAGWLMRRYGWDACWAPDSDGFLFDWPAKFYVGVVAGPDVDLVCVRRTTDRVLAECYLSPSGESILEATLVAARKFHETEGS